MPFSTNSWLSAAHPSLSLPRPPDPSPRPQCKDHNATNPPARSNRDITIYRIQQYSFKLIILYLQECKVKQTNKTEAQRACSIPTRNWPSVGVGSTRSGGRLLLDHPPAPWLPNLCQKRKEKNGGKERKRTERKERKKGKNERFGSFFHLLTVLGLLAGLKKKK